jgi:hypothetical protein
MFEADYSLALHRWPVVRLRSGSKTEMILCSMAFFPLTTHWVAVGKGRTVPCCVTDCDLCELLPSRGLFYVAGVVMSQVSLVELGAASASHFEQHAKLLHGGMRPGLVFELSRSGAKQPIRSEVIRFQEKVQPIPILSLAAHVLALYRLPCPNPDETIERYSVRLQALVQRRNVQLALEFKAHPKTGVKT